jgi:hypothetical protein
MNFKKSGPYYILAKDAWKIPTIVFILVPLKFVFSHVPCSFALEIGNATGMPERSRSTRN